MIETCAKQQVMDMVLIRLERTAMLFDTRQTDTNGIEDRYGQYANCNRRRGIHMIALRDEMIGIDFAEPEHESRQQVPQEQTSRIAHEDLLLASEHIIDEEHRQGTDHTDA